MGRTLIVIGFVALFVLHQDFWNWDNTSTVFGFMPVGLAYHAGFSIAAALLWLAAIKLAWPAETEAWAETEDEAPDATDTAQTQDGGEPTP